MFFRLPQQRGEVVDVMVEQDGIDVAVNLWSPWRRVLRVDRLNYTKGPEPVFAVTDEDGLYCLEIVSNKVEPEAPRALQVRLASPRPVSARDQIQAAGHLTLSRAEGLRQEGRIEAALPLYGKSRVLFRATGEREGWGTALYRMGDIQFDRAQFTEAQASLTEAVSAFAGTREEAMAANKLGSAYEALGQVSRGEATLERGLAIARHWGDRRRVIGAQTNLGRIYQQEGKLQDALRSFTEALEGARREDSPQDKVKALVGLADCHLDLGNLDSARDTAQEAIRIEKDLRYGRDEAISRRALALAYLRLGNHDVAVQEAKKALRLAQKAGDPAEQAEALQVLGDERYEAQRPDEALPYYEEALARVRPTGNDEVTARALMGIGVVRGLQGDRELKDLQEAERLFHQSGDEDSRAWVLEHRALVLRRQERLEEARVAIVQALEILDPLRGRPASRYLRSSFLASRYSAWELAVDILVELEQKEPGHGYGVRSFEIGERVRARTFLDDLAAGRAVVQPTISPDTERRQAEIEQKLAAEEKAGNPEAVRQLRVERDLLEEQIRKVEPGYYVEHAQPLTVPEAQALLDEKTTLLAYMLGDDQSFLWRVRHNSLESLPLPPRKEIEAQAKAAHDALEQRTVRLRNSLEEALARIAKTVLGPVAGRLGQDRLLVVADGALQTVPFAVLPESGRRLVETHVVVDLPSVSIAAAMRQEMARRRPPPGLLALLADPVYGEDDDRFPVALRRPASPLPAGALADAARSLRDLKIGRFERLPSTGDEAEAILRMVPSGLALRALGFDANLDQAKSPDLANFRFLHFATHGIFHATHPELSGLVLSRFDRDGHPREAFLRAYEIEHLRLPVDLVVLSACKTALGSEVRGEGLSGLPRSFMYAGAPRVVVSLWSVSDKATAHLMEIFYRGLLREGLRPAEALRAAQLEMMQSREWQEPYYWAGFVLNGDWH